MSSPETNQQPERSELELAQESCLELYGRFRYINQMYLCEKYEQEFDDDFIPAELQNITDFEINLILSEGYSDLHLEAKRDLFTDELMRRFRNLSIITLDSISDGQIIDSRTANARWDQSFVFVTNEGIECFWRWKDPDKDTPIFKYNPTWHLDNLKSYNLSLGVLPLCAAAQQLIEQS